MNLTRYVDGYCERVEPGLWAEPLNAVTNLAFLLAAVVMWRRTGGAGLAGVLCVLLGLIGLASGAFHTMAVVWTAAADSISIVVFVLVYLYAANRQFLDLAPIWAFGGVMLALPYFGMMAAVFSLIPALGSSAVYAPVVLLIALYGLWLAPRRATVARGLLLGAGVLLVSLTLRTLDAPLCASLPMGTHFWWHILNAVMLAWMIEVYHRSTLANGG
ncbi:MAG: ceramidase domain-containing protein [Sedimentitalea sp.]